MMRNVLIVFAGLFATAAIAAEPVAQLGRIEGTVLVSQGEQFATAAEGQALQAGDRVLVMEGAVASVDFADGCVLPLASGSLVDVPAVSTCAGGIASVHTVGPVLAQADTASTESGAGMSGTTKTVLLVGGGVALVAVAVSGDDSDRPTSP